MREPRVSVVLPTHNSPDTLRLAIETALYQTFDDFELIVVGDGCTDHTAEVVSDFGDDRIVWLDQPKAPGFGYANRNVALHRARGELVAYLPHDDLWTPDHLELLVAAADDRSAEFIYSRLLRVDEDGNIEPATFNIHAPGVFERLRPSHLSMGIGTVMHSRRCLTEYGFWDESGRGGGDHRLWAHFISSLGLERVAFVPEPTLLHFVAEWRKLTRPRWLPRFPGRAHRSVVYSEFLPPTLRIDVAQHRFEQEAVWAEMSADPDAWTRRMRRAVVAALDARLEQADDRLTLLLGGISTKLGRTLSRLVRRAQFKRRRRSGIGGS